MDYSGGNHRQYSRTATHQVAWASVSGDASSGYRIYDCFLDVARILEVCLAALLKRQFVNSRTRIFSAESPCGVGEMFLIKRPFFRRQSIRRALTRYRSEEHTSELQSHSF